MNIFNQHPQYDVVAGYVTPPNSSGDIINVQVIINNKMSVQETINCDVKNAMREKNVEVRDLLRVVIGEFNRVDKIVGDEKALAIIKKMVDNAKEQGNDGEVTILEKYLPSQMDELELKRVLMNHIMNLNSPTMKDMGSIMGFLKQNHGGTYDGKLASSLVRELLS